MSTNAMTPTFRVSFPNVFRPKKNDMNGKDEYSLVALFPKGTDLAPLKKAAQEAIEAKWGKDKSKWPTNLRSPFRDQGERKREVNGKMVLPDGYEDGAVFLNLKSIQRPGIVDQQNQDIINEHDFYPGCFARATVRAFAYDNKGNKGVSFGLQNIQKVKDGDPLGGRTKAADDFEPIQNSGGDDASADELFM